MLGKIEYGIIGIGLSACVLNLVLPEFTFELKFSKRFFVICGSITIGYHLITNL